jgi:hypothetical protein
MLMVMEKKAHATIKGTLLGAGGSEINKDVWEESVYLGRDGFVYHVKARSRHGEVETEIAAKRSTGEYLRWVDGLFRPGEIPSEASSIHYRAARKLRELL